MEKKQSKWKLTKREDKDWVKLEEDKKNDEREREWERREIKRNLEERGLTGDEK